MTSPINPSVAGDRVFTAVYDAILSAVYGSETPTSAATKATGAILTTPSTAPEGGDWRTVSVAWVVTGMVGEYSDRAEWPVRIFYSADQAKAFAEHLDAKGREWWAKWNMDRYSNNPERDADEARLREIEPGWAHDYTGPAIYTACEVPVCPPASAAPQPKPDERLAKAMEALRPFAAAGRAIDVVGFGEALFANDKRAFEASWSDNGQYQEIVWRDFRRAAEALRDLEQTP